MVLIDASNLGKKFKDGKNQKTVLNQEEEQRIIDAFNCKKVQYLVSDRMFFEQLK